MQMYFGEKDQPTAYLFRSSEERELFCYTATLLCSDIELCLENVKRQDGGQRTVFAVMLVNKGGAHKPRTLVLDCKQGVLERRGAEGADIKERIPVKDIEMKVTSGDQHELVLWYGKNGQSKHTHVHFPSGYLREHFMGMVRVMQGQRSKSVGQNVQVGDLRLWIGTWNVGDKPPPKDLSELSKWIPPQEFDMYAIGFQENSQKDAWVRALGTHLNAGSPHSKLFKKQQLSTSENAEAEDDDDHSAAKPDEPDSAAAADQKSRSASSANRVGAKKYAFMTVTSLWDIHLVVIVAEHMIHRIREVVTCTEATGIGHVLGNKGGAACGFILDDTTGFAFLTSHLAARAVRVEQRAENYGEIVRGISLGGPHPKHIDLLHQFHHLFWFGDLNYRLDFGSMGTPDEFKKVVAMSKAKQVDELVAADQLYKEQALQKVFNGFQEGPITFPPTYRMIKGKDEYSNKKNQNPSYTDRVLWRSNAPAMLANSSYTACFELNNSDHRAVTATFDVTPIPQHRVTPAADDSQIDSSTGFRRIFLPKLCVRIRPEVDNPLDKAKKEKKKEKAAKKQSEAEQSGKKKKEKKRKKSVNLGGYDKNANVFHEDFDSAFVITIQAAFAYRPAVTLPAGVQMVAKPLYSSKEGSESAAGEKVLQWAWESRDGCAPHVTPFIPDVEWLSAQNLIIVVHKHTSDGPVVGQAHFCLNDVCSKDKLGQHVPFEVELLNHGHMVGVIDGAAFMEDMPFMCARTLQKPEELRRLRQWKTMMYSNRELWRVAPAVRSQRAQTSRMVTMRRGGTPAVGNATQSSKQILQDCLQSAVTHSEVKQAKRRGSGMVTFQVSDEAADAKTEVNKPLEPMTTEVEVEHDDDGEEIWVIHALGKKWEPEEFCCSHPDCAESFGEDASEFYPHDDKPYCKIHYLEMFGQDTCSGCLCRLSNGDSAISAIGRRWHVDHFACVHCNTAIGIADAYFEVGGEPYCESDYLSLFRSCAGCGDTIPINGDADDAIEALGKMWHRDCFVCVECNCGFQDGSYYIMDDGGSGKQPYCKNDFLNNFVPRCAGCQLFVEDEEPTMLGESTWHSACLKCQECQCTFDAESSFVEHEEAPWCEQHYLEAFGSRCAGCEEFIGVGEASLEALAQTWHSKCFRCETCNCDFITDEGEVSFFEKGLRPYCKKDYQEQFCDKCHSCDEYIFGDAVKALGVMWHKEHLKCTHCDLVLQDAIFGAPATKDASSRRMSEIFQHDGLPYCEEHWDELFGCVCARCGLAIEDDSLLEAGSSKYHNKCFQCVQCNCTLGDGEQYYMKDFKPYCEEHFLTMFCDMCAYCQKPIAPEDPITELPGLGKKYHDGHLVCHHCEKPFDVGDTICQKDNEPYCKQDYLKLFCDNCADCGEPIVGAHQKAFDKKWHKGHVRCFECKKEFTDGKLFVRTGEDGGKWPTCASHAKCPLLTLSAQGQAKLAGGASAQPELVALERKASSATVRRKLSAAAGTAPAMVARPAAAPAAAASAAAAAAAAAPAPAAAAGGCGCAGGCGGGGGGRTAKAPGLPAVSEHGMEEAAHGHIEDAAAAHQVDVSTFQNVGTRSTGAKRKSAIPSSLSALTASSHPVGGLMGNRKQSLQVPILEGEDETKMGYLSKMSAAKSRFGRATWKRR
jgi:hypothetical protein